MLLVYFWALLATDAKVWINTLASVNHEFYLASMAAQYHSERNHQGIGNQIIESGNEVGQAIGVIQCRERLGGMLKYYHRQAA
jgi:hypothetical protein